jgi:hypothetical protein
VHVAHARLGDAVFFARRVFQQRIAQHRQRGFDLAPAALGSARVRKISQASGRLEVLAPVARLVAQLHQPPGLQFLQAHADVAAAEFQALGDVVGIAPAPAPRRPGRRSGPPCG